MARRKSEQTDPAPESLEATPAPAPLVEQAAPVEESDAPADYNLDENAPSGPPQVERASESPSDASAAPDDSSDVESPKSGTTGLVEAQSVTVGDVASPTVTTFQKEEPKPGEEAAQRDPERVPDEGEQAANLSVFDVKGDLAPTQPTGPAPGEPMALETRPRTFTVLQNISTFRPGAVVSMEELGIQEKHLPRLITRGVIYENDPR